jgi:cobalt/nickel transport system permease protein
LKSKFADRTLQSIVALLRGALFAEEIAAKRGLLQSLDPRVRLVCILSMLGLVLFAKTLPLLMGFYSLSIMLALSSGIGLFFFLARTWFFIPLFSLFIAVPAIFQGFTPGEVVFSIGPWGVTRQGLMGAAFFISRTACSVSFAVLLSLTTRHFDLLKVLRTIGVPKVFVMVTGMTYRYIYLLLEMVENLHRAVKSRVGNATTGRGGRRFVAWNITGLWLRSHQLSEQVFGAMRSRGYRGEPVLLHGFRTRAWDWVFLSIFGLLFTAIVWGMVRGTL